MQYWCFSFIPALLKPANTKILPACWRRLSTSSVSGSTPTTLETLEKIRVKWVEAFWKAIFGSYSFGYDWANIWDNFKVMFLIKN